MASQAEGTAVRAHVKVCGVCSPEDAIACVGLGVSAIGLNFVGTSPRRVDPATAKVIARSAHEEAAKAGVRILVVGVVATGSPDPAPLRELAREVGLDCLQLHGDEPKELVEALLPHAYKAARIATRDDVRTAEAFPGEHLLVDARVEGHLGGTGHSFDWSLVEALATRRKLTLAGGLRPENVRAAIDQVRPYCVDVASGVERSVREKDLDRIRAFVRAARGI